MSNPSVQVATLIRELHVSSVRAQKLFTERTAEQLLHKPDERSRSAAECLEHLNLTNRSYLSRLEPNLAHLRSRNVLAVKPFRLNCNAAVLKYWLEPPSRLRLPTSARFLPLRVQDPGGHPTRFLRFASQTGWPSRIVARTRARSSHARFALREEHEIQRRFSVCSHRSAQSPAPVASGARQPLRIDCTAHSDNPTQGE
jgi:DinB superfamily